MPVPDWTGPRGEDSEDKLRGKSFSIGLDRKPTRASDETKNSFGPLQVAGADCKSYIYVCGGRFKSQSAFAPIPEIVEVLAASLAPPERERWFTAIVNCNKIVCSGTAAATAFMSRHISAT